MIIQVWAAWTPKHSLWLHMGFVTLLFYRNPGVLGVLGPFTISCVLGLYRLGAK